MLPDRIWNSKKRAQAVLGRRIGEKKKEEKRKKEKEKKKMTERSGAGGAGCDDGRWCYHELELESASWVDPG